MVKKAKEDYLVADWQGAHATRVPNFRVCLQQRRGRWMLEKFGAVSLSQPVTRGILHVHMVRR